jgi:hypothetical protein
MKLSDLLHKGKDLSTDQQQTNQALESFIDERGDGEVPEGQEQEYIREARRRYGLEADEEPDDIESE